MRKMLVPRPFVLNGNKHKKLIVKLLNNEISKIIENNVNKMNFNHKIMALTESTGICFL